MKAMRLAALALSMILILGALGGCTNSIQPTQSNVASSETTAEPTPEPTPELEKVLEYTYFTNVETVPASATNTNDVVTPFVEKKFNIRVKDIIARGTQMPMEKLNMMVAAGNLPDVVETDNPNLGIFFASGEFADLAPYKPLLVNTGKYISDIGWNMLTIDGKLAALPTGGDINVKNPDVAAIVESDLFYRPMQNWVMYVREDILKQLGYSFKTVKEVQAELDANPRKITDDDVKLEPAIDTFEKFNKLLYDIKALDIKVGGKNLYPLQMQEWGVYHFSVLFTHHAAFMGDPSSMDVTGFYDNPGMKEYYKQLNQWLKDGIVDPDFLINKPEQQQEKIASGRAAIFMWTPDTNAARTSIQSLGDGADIRPIPWPKTVYGGGSAYVDPSYPCGFTNVLINKKLPEADITRLLKYFDWMNSEEAMDLLSWGPESAGLYEIKDGKKQFKDAALWDAINNGKKTDDGRDADYYGIMTGLNRAWFASPKTIYNHLSPQHNYPAKFNAFTDMFTYLSTQMLCRDGTVIAATGAAASEVNGYYWSTSRVKFAPTCFFAKTEDEFNKSWDEMVANFKSSTPYDDAIKEIQTAFNRNMGK